MSALPSPQMELFNHVTADAALASTPGRSPSSWSAPAAADPEQAGLSLCVLGSGSSGNATVVRLGRQAILIDLGLGPRTLPRRLAGTGVALTDVQAVCLTHLDSDHFQPRWLCWLLERQVRLCVHRRHIHALYLNDGARALQRAGLLHVFDGQAFHPLGDGAGLHVQPIALPHDEDGAQGFLLRTPLGRIGYATDLGHVPEPLVEAFAGVDVLAIESNYDVDMEQASARPWFLKRRIMGGHGHLSNAQAFEAVVRILDRSGPAHPRRVVLLHRSRQCNCPQLLRRFFARDPRLQDRLVLAEQGQRTEWIC